MRRSSSIVLLALLALLALSTSACMEPLQSGGVMIVGDPSSRLEMLCKLQLRGGGAESFCVSDEVAGVPSEDGELPASPQ